MNLKVKLLSEYAKVPTYGSGYAAGMDVFSCIDCFIPPKSRKLIPIGISVSFADQDYYLRLASRSGLASKSCVDVGAGVIDFDYRGEIHVLLINNHNDNGFDVKIGDKIAQLIMERIIRPSITRVDELDETIRGSNGFGSTG
jgi:dUTP pyrophosphatase